LSSNKSIEGMGKSLSDDGYGEVSWNFKSDDGSTRTLKLPAYHIKSSTQKIASTSLILDHYPQESIAISRTELRLSGSKTDPPLTIKLCPIMGLPLGQVFAAQELVEVPPTVPKKVVDPLLELHPHPPVTASSNFNLTDPEKELLRWHYRLGHLSFARIQWMFRQGFLANTEKTKRLQTAALRLTSGPMCAACQYAKQRRKTTPGKVTNTNPNAQGQLVQNRLFPGQQVSVDHFHSNPHGRLLTSFGKEAPNQKYTGGAIFVDHSSGYIDVELQSHLNSHETLNAKIAFEKRCLSDNGTAFRNEEYEAHLRQFHQTVRHSGVGAHHSNGLAERTIGTVMSISWAMLHHAAIHWPDVADVELWPLAVLHAAYLLNRVPRPDTGQSALELFSRTTWARSKFHDFHVWGCPVYVLDGKLSDGNKLPRWKPRSGRHTYVGSGAIGAAHSHSIPLVLSLDTGKITHQYHVVFDDWFNTVSSTNAAQIDFDQPDWYQTFGLTESQYMRDEDEPLDLDPPTSIEREILDHSHAAEHQRELLLPPTPLSAPVAPRSTLPGPTPTVQPPVAPTLTYWPTPAPVHIPGLPPGLTLEEAIRRANLPSPTPHPRPVPPGIIEPSLPKASSPQREKITPSQPPVQRRQSISRPLPTPARAASPKPPTPAKPVEPKAAPPLRRSPRLADAKPAALLLAGPKMPGVQGRSPTMLLANREAANCILPLLNEDGLKTSSFTALVYENKAKILYAEDNPSILDPLMAFWCNKFDILRNVNAAKAMKDPDVLTWEQAMRSDDRAEWLVSADAEIRKLEAQDTWVEDLKSNATNPIIPGMWTLRYKRTPDGTLKKRKSRYVLRGDLMSNFEGRDNFAPVASWTTVRSFLVLSAVTHRVTCTIDFSNAFVQSPLPKDDPVWMHPPRGYKCKNGPDWCLKLKKSLYGHKVAPLMWYNYIATYFGKLGLHKSTFDPCLWFGTDIMLVQYVDDCGISAAKQSTIDDFVAALRKEGLALTQEESFSEFLGIEFQESKEGKFHMTQGGLIKKVLQAAGMSDCNPNSTPAAVAPVGADKDGEPMEETWNYRAIVGMLLYLSGNSRPDIAFAVSQVARFSNNPKKSHATAIKMILRYLKGTMDKGTMVDPIKDLHDLQLHLYVDADFAGLFKREDDWDPNSVKSRTGYIIFLNRWPIVWKSQLQTHILLSTMEAEYLALSTALKVLLPLKWLIQEMLIKLNDSRLTNTKIHATVFEDNQSAYTLATTHRITNRTKYLLSKFHWFWSHKDEFKIVPCSTHDMLADGCTKPLSCDKFEKNRLGIIGW